MRFEGSLLRRFPPREAEHSRRFRLAVLLNTLAAFGAYATVDQDFSVWVPLLLVSLGTLYSYWRRAKSNFAMKWLLAAGMIYALYDALHNLLNVGLDPRLTLAQLLVWLQVLNSYDLPSRKNLRVSLLVTSVLIIVACTVSRTPEFGWLILAFALTLIWGLHEAFLSELGARPMPLPLVGRATLGVLLAMAAIAPPVFLLAPRQARDLDTHSMPLSLHLPLPENLDVHVRNASLSAGTQGSAATNRGYNGFSERLDLNVRSAPSETVVLRVKSDRPEYWRAMAFDRYDGRGWSMSQPTQVQTMLSENPPTKVTLPSGQDGGTPLVQTFYVERDQANLIFCAWTPTQVYFPTSLFWRDPYDGLRSPVALQKDMYYSVVSETPAFDPASLALRHARRLPDGMQSYLQLPALSRRTRALASRLAAGKTPYLAVQAISDYLKSHYTYDLNVPVAPAGREWVDYFLFEQHAGFCEQFATSLAVMARSQCIPTRLVTGYLPGDYNLLTGFYEVKGKHAHAWVEAWMPSQGWLPFDATPASADPAEQHGSSQRSFSEALRPFLTALVAPRVGQTALALVLLGMLWTALRFRPTRLPPATRLYRRLRTRLRRAGVPTQPHDTPGAWLEAAARVPAVAPALSELAAFVRDYEALRFGGAGDAEALAVQLRRVEASLRARR